MDDVPRIRESIDDCEVLAANKIVEPLPVPGRFFRKIVHGAGLAKQRGFSTLPAQKRLHPRKVFEWFVLAQNLTIFEALQTFQQEIQVKKKARTVWLSSSKS